MTILEKIRDAYTLARVRLDFFLFGFYLHRRGV